MNKIPTLKQILPQSPDEIQKFSSEASAAPARLAHLNRAALYFGMEADIIEIDWSLSTDVFINKPSGCIKLININMSPDDTRQFNIIWDSAVYQALKNVKTPCYVQFTPISDGGLKAIYPLQPPDNVYDAYIQVECYTALSAPNFYFFYSIIPQ